jgi:hypothetical protein
MVAEFLQDGITSGIAIKIGRSPVGREVTQDVPKSHLILDNLILFLLSCQIKKVLVRPGMAGELMARCSGPLYDACPCRIYLTFSKIVSRNEKGNLGLIRIQDIEQVISIDPRPIVKSQCNDAVLCAIGNLDSVRYRPDQGSCKARSRDTAWRSTTTLVSLVCLRTWIIMLVTYLASQAGPYSNWQSGALQ